MLRDSRPIPIPTVVFEDGRCELWARSSLSWSSNSRQRPQYKTNDGAICTTSSCCFEMKRGSAGRIDPPQSDSSTTKQVDGGVRYRLVGQRRKTEGMFGKNGNETQYWPLPRTHDAVLKAEIL